MENIGIARLQWCCCPHCVPEWRFIWTEFRILWM